jgi:SSS family solute:Na+ symporter
MIRLFIRILSWASGLDLLTSKIITAVGFGLYVIIGGYLAVVWTDTVQAVILFVGFILLAIMAVPAAGGFENIRATVSPESLSFLGIEKSGFVPAVSLAVSISVGSLIPVENSSEESR